MNREANGKLSLHLSEFGITKNITDNAGGRLSTSSGEIDNVIENQPPENLRFGFLKKPDFCKQDVWAIGIIAYQLCTFHYPFNGKSKHAKIKAIINNPHTPIEQDYS
jgi:hypothetical protein